MKQLIIKSLTTLSILAFANGLVAQAAISNVIPKPDTLPGPSVDSMKDDEGQREGLTEIFIPRFAAGFVGFVGIAAFLFLVVAGVRYLTAYGDEEAAEKAKNQAKFALVGLVIALLAFTIVSIIINIDLADI